MRWLDSRRLFRAKRPDQTVRTRIVRIDHYEAGEIIIAKGEIGRELFIVRRGEVEVFQPSDDGGAEEVITKLHKGDVFGEKALLEDTLRNASVRAKGAVDVLVIVARGFHRDGVASSRCSMRFRQAHERALPGTVPDAVPIAQRSRGPRQPGTGRSH